MRPRFFTSRAEKVKERCLFPKRKPKHTKYDIKELIKKEEQDYVDIQQATGKGRVKIWSPV